MAKRRTKRNEKQPDPMERVRAAGAYLRDTDDQDAKLAAYMAIFHDRPMTRAEVQKVRRK